MAQRHFFALSNDLLPVFDRVEKKHSLAYTLCGMFESAAFRSFENGASLPALGEEAGSSSINCETYLVCPTLVPVQARALPQLIGGTKYAIDQLANPDTVTLSLGGLHPSGTLISGRVATTSQSVAAKTLQSAFARAIGAQFTRVRAFYVGPSALMLLQRGGRLTQNISSPPEYNLALSGA